MKNLKLITGIICLTLLFVGCNKEDQQTGRMTVKMTDAPADFVEVNVELKEVWVHYASGHNGQSGWVQVNTNPGIYNLLDLQNDISVVIADQGSLAVGKITQMRLILGDNNYAVSIDSDSLQVNYDLLLSSQDETGLKININSDIVANQTLQILLDFDAEASIVEEGNGSLRLKPVIKLESVIYLP